MIELTNYVKLYIPSTVNGAQSASQNLVNETIDGVVTLFSQWFGGATQEIAQGAWYSEEHGIVREPVTLVTAFCTPDALAEFEANVIQLCVAIKQKFSQESVAMERSGSLILV